eukprot:1651274-Pleurochrysis_carterae.AAC.1
MLADPKPSARSPQVSPAAHAVSGGSGLRMAAQPFGHAVHNAQHPRYAVARRSQDDRNLLLLARNPGICRSNLSRNTSLSRCEQCQKLTRYGKMVSVNRLKPSTAIYVTVTSRLRPEMRSWDRSADIHLLRCMRS